MIRWIAGSITAGVVVLAAPAAEAAAPPIPVEFQFTIPANAGTGGCDFDVLLEGSGNTKTMSCQAEGPSSSRPTRR